MATNGRRDPFQAGISRKDRKVTEQPIQIADLEDFIDIDFTSPNFVFANPTMTDLWAATNPDHNFFKRGGTLDHSYGGGICVSVVYKKQHRNIAFPFPLADMQRALTVLKTAHELGFDHRVLA